MNKGVSPLKILSFVLFFIILLVYLASLNDIIMLENIQTISVIGIFIYLFIFFTWKKSYYRIMSPYFVFVTLLFMCLCGQCIMWSLDLSAGFRDLRTWCNLFDDETLCDALLFSYTCILFFHSVVIGSINSKTKKTTIRKIKRIESKSVQIIEKKEAYKKIALFGIIMCIVFFVPYFISAINQYKIIQTYGYDSQYDFISYGVNSIFSKLAEFFPVGIITIIFAWGNKNQYNKENYSYKFIIGYGLSAFYLFFELLLGQRTGVILFIIALLFVIYKDKKIPKQQIIKLGVLAFALMCFLRIVGVARSGEEVDITNLEENPAIDFLSDTGWNLMSLAEFQELLPKVKDYSYGMSYLVSFTAMIPNLNLWEVHPAYEYGNISNWLREYLGFSFGLGCTPIAEAYYNFGSCGFLVFYFWGQFLVYLNRKFEDSESILNNYLIVLFIGILLKSCVRGSFYAVFRPLVLYVILPTIIVNVLCARKEKTRKESSEFIDENRCINMV